ncbi:MFS transporter [Amycolatopsis sp. NPDC059657]|uniref:MFS transporter n=1 Tax=Amycolatopsis sp. NPDC059657 TaxID=3346899 RepID=UPI00367245A0
MSLLRHADFRRLWAGDTLSQFGQKIGETAIPLLAATVLAATPMQMGVLTAAETAAFLVIGLPAGVWVDRWRRRPIMLRADFVRAALLISVPIAWWAGVLTLGQLIVVALLTGVCTVFFDLAYQSYLPSLVGREHLLEGNSKLQSSLSVAQVAGPGLGGALVQLAGAANAVLTTGIGFLCSALCLARIKTVEPEPVRHEDEKLWPRITEGLRFVFGNPLLRPITCATGTANLGNLMLGAVTVLFLTREVGLSPAAVGALLAVAGIGSVAGALTARWCIARIGQVRSIWLVSLVSLPGQLLLPFAAPGWRIGLAAFGLLLFGYGVVVYNVAQLSFRQSICPDGMLGRMNASIRFLVYGIQPIGGLLGGLLGELIGVRGAVFAGAAVQASAVLWLIVSPIRKLRDVPELVKPG